VLCISPSCHRRRQTIQYLSLVRRDHSGNNSSEEVRSSSFLRPGRRRVDVAFPSPDVERGGCEVDLGPLEGRPAHRRAAHGGRPARPWWRPGGPRLPLTASIRDSTSPGVRVRALPVFGIRPAQWPNCPIFGSWRHQRQMRFCHENSPCPKPSVRRIGFLQTV
jgi:hypothetical protein